MPVTVVLAWNGFIVAGLAFAGVKFGLVLAQQFQIRTEVNRAIDHQKYQTVPASIDAHKPPDADQTLSSQNQCAFNVWKACTVLFTTIRFVIRILEAFDPDSDAMTPGIAHQSYSKAQETAFVESWASTPVIGPLVGRLGLPYMLLVGVVAYSIWQVHVFAGTVKGIELEFADPACVERRRGIYAKLYHLSDTASLHILSVLFKALWVNSPGRGNKPVDRYHSYRARVPEMVFQGWFLVDALALLMNNPESDMLNICSILFSIMTSAVASVMSFYDMASIFVPWSESMRESPRMKWNVLKVSFCMFVHVVASVMMVIRFIGVWTCQSHQFSVISLACSK